MIFDSWWPHNSNVSVVYDTTIVFIRNYSEFMLAHLICNYRWKLWFMVDIPNKLMGCINLRTWLLGVRPRRKAWFLNQQKVVWKQQTAGLIELIEPAGIAKPNAGKCWKMTENLGFGLSMIPQKKSHGQLVKPPIGRWQSSPSPGWAPAEGFEHRHPGRNVAPGHVWSAPFSGLLWSCDVGTQEIEVCSQNMGHKLSYFWRKSIQRFLLWNNRYHIPSHFEVPSCRLQIKICRAKMFCTFKSLNFEI